MTKRGKAIPIGDYWQVVPPGGDAGEIGLREDLPWWKRLYARWLKKTPVLKMYREVQSWLASSEGIVFCDAMYHGNLKISEEVKKKLPPVFQLMNGWSIRKDSVGALIHGPLLNSNGDTILVATHGWLSTLVVAIESSVMWRLFLIIAAIISFVALIYGY